MAMSMLRLARIALGTSVFALVLGGCDSRVSSESTLTSGVGSEQAELNVAGTRKHSPFAMGGYHSCELTRLGTVYCHGDNDWGQLGFTGADTSTPTLVTQLTGQLSLGAGTFHTCSVDGDGTAWCWGQNNYGQLGNGTVSGGVTSTPQRVKTAASSYLRNITGISGGTYHTCATRAGGTMRCWGRNNTYQLGTGNTTDQTYASTFVPGGYSWVTASVGSLHSCGLTAGGLVYCWGDNTYGQIGNGGTTTAQIPTLVPGLSGVVDISATSWSTCAVLTSGNMKCWGRNQEGQVGDGTTTSPRLSPTTVMSSGTPLRNITAVDGGAYHVCAHSVYGALCWGDNTQGQVGTGTTASP
jgi:alpha-tubulin suppressor-like RCC1 family protein